MDTKLSIWWQCSTCDEWHKGTPTMGGPCEKSDYGHIWQKVGHGPEGK